MAPATRRRARHAGFALLLAGLSCNEPAAYRETPVRLLATSVFAGGEFLVRLGGPLSGLQVLVDAESVATRAIDDSTLGATVPQRNGWVTVSVRDSSGGITPMDRIHVFGFRDAYDGPRVNGYILPAPDGSPNPSFLANGESSLVLVDLSLNTVQAYPRAMHDPNCMRGPGPTPDPTIFVLAARDSVGACRWREWRLWPAPQLVLDSVPQSSRIVAQLNASTWLVGAAHQICLSPRPLSFANCRQYEDMQGIRFSPRRDRAYLYFAYSPTNHVSVFDTTTGDTAFSVTEALASGGGGFSANGDTLYLAGVMGGCCIGDTARLYVINANTGARYATVPLEFTAEDVLADPASPYVYVFGWASGLSDSLHAAFPHLAVIDRGTLKIVGHVIGPPTIYGNVPLCWQCNSRLIIDPVRRILYMVGTGLDGPALSPARTGRFDLMP